MAYIGHVGNQADKQATFRFEGTCYRMSFCQYQEGLCIERKSSCKGARIDMVWSTQVYPKGKKPQLLKFVL